MTVILPVVGLHGLIGQAERRYRFAHRTSTDLITQLPSGRQPLPWDFFLLARHSPVIDEQRIWTSG